MDKEKIQKKKRLLENSAERTPHYGLRKLSVGVASVLLSTTLWMSSNGSVAHADTTSDSATTEQTSNSSKNVSSSSEEKAASTNDMAQPTHPANLTTSTSQATTESTANTNTASTDDNTADTAASAESTAGNAASTTTSQSEVAVNQSVAASNSDVANASSSSAEANAPAESQTASESSASNMKNDTAKSQVASQTNTSEQTNAATENSADLQKADIAANNVENATDAQAQNELASSADKQNTEKNSNTVTLDAKAALKTSAVASINKKMLAASLASTKLADQYEAKGAEYTEIYGQTIDPKNLISNFSELPTGTTASAGNLDAIKTKQGRNLVPVTVTYSDGSTDTANAIVWVTSQGVTALAKEVNLQRNPNGDKAEIIERFNTPLPIYYKGTAIINGSDITKGASIYLASLAEKYRQGIGHTFSIQMTDDDGDELGNLVLIDHVSGKDQPHNDLVLNITSSKTYTGDVNIKFSVENPGATQTWTISTRKAYITETDEPYDYSGTIVQKLWLHAMGQSDDEYTRKIPVGDIKEAELTDWELAQPSMNILAFGKGDYSNKATIALTVPLFGYAGATSNKNEWTIDQVNLVKKLYSEIWSSKGKEKPADLPSEENYREVFQVVTPYDTLPSDLTITAGMSGAGQLATADGKPSNDTVPIHGSVTYETFLAEDGLTAQDLYDQTPSGKIGMSKQSDNTLLISVNLPLNSIVPTSVDMTWDEKLNKDYDAIVSANNDFYLKNVVPSFSEWRSAISIYINSKDKRDSYGKWIISNVTPNESPYSDSVYAYPPKSWTDGGSADGKTQKIVSAYFVDDNQNQAVVGKINQVKGGVGDTVPLNMIIPDGYILADGQTLPTSYTFANTNSDVIVHLISLSKETHATDTVNRTINYKTTDGSNAPASKTDSLTFYGTKTTGDLDKLVTRAGQDGLTVNKGDAKEYSTKEEALADLDKQAQTIQSALTKYEAEKAAYDSAKKIYDQDLAKWNASQNADHTVKGISQSLSFNGETDADLKVSTSDGSPVNYIKSKSWLGSNNKGVYSMDNIAKFFGDSDISYSFAEGTAADFLSWGKTYTGVQMKTGQSVIAQYTGLKNSVYIDSTGAAHKLSKVKIKYTLNSTTAADRTANIFLSNNPNIAFWYAASSGSSAGSVDFTLDMTFYDQDGNAITLGKGSNAWLSMSSLNRDTTTTEYFNPGNNTTMEIPGSTIIKHDDGWYADSSNEANGTAWDSTTSSDRYYGAAIMELEGNSFHVGKKVDAGQGVYSWNAIDSNLATAYKPTSPAVPTKPTVNWHETTANVWDANKDFTDVASPTVKGYTPNRKTVSNKNIAHNAADIVETVTYTPDAQKGTVTYIDDNTGKTLKTDTLTGVTNAKSGYTTKASIDTYKKAGYVVVSDTTNGIEIVYDSDDAVDQGYTVHLKHDTKTPAEKRHYATVTRTITYKMSDGSKAPDGVSDSLTFTAQDTVDAVTGAVVSTTWSGNQNFADVTSPVIAGYTADKKTVSNKSIAHDHANITEIVTYTPDKQTATVTYIDNTTGKTLKTETLNGMTNAKSGYTTKSSIDGYKALGYVLTADTTNGSEVVFDTDDGSNQAYTVTLAHGYQTVTNTDNIKVGSAINSNANGAKWPKGTDKASLEDSVKRTINYIIANGKKAAPASVSDSLAYIAAATVDKVTGEIVKTVWSASQNFKDVASPAVKGYTPNRSSVSNTAIAHDHADITETVTYNPDKQTATVSYLDDTTGKQIRFDSLSGRTLEGSGYNTKSIISNYQNNGYVLVSDPTNGAEVVFDDDDNASQAYTVVLKHTYITVTPDKPASPDTPINSDSTGVQYPEGTDKASLTNTVNRTITYVVMGGKDTAPSQVKDSLSYTASKTIDRVTGEIVKTVWTAAQDFNDVASPSLKGYTVDRTSVSDKNIAHGHADIVETVTYVPNKQSAAVTYHDDTTGKVLKIVNLSGYTHSDAGYSTKGSIIDYIELGYNLVSDSSNGAGIIFDNEDGKDQTYDVHLKHETVTVTPSAPGKPGKAINLNPDGAKWPEGTDKVSLEDDVNRTITYVVKGGKDAVPASVNDSLHYEAAKVIDKVTGEVLSTKWDLNQSFKTITTPTIKGYTPDKLAIVNTNVAHGDPDIKEVVTYSPDAQKAAVTYVDQTTGKTLKSVALDGVTHAGSGYTTKSSIDGYVNLGYKLVSDDTKGAEIVFDNDDAVDQAYKILLDHDYATVTSDMNKQAGTPINNDANGAKWPAGSTKSALQHDVKRNITYVIANSKKSAPASVNDILHYEATATIDKVTGQVVKTVWSNAQDFNDVASPAVKGYTADKKSISDKNIAHDHADIKEVVTYAPDAQKAAVTYVDQTTGKTLTVKALTGHTLEDTGYNTAGDIKNYVDNGYDLVGDTSKGAEIIFDDEDGIDQAYTVTLKHGVATINETSPGKPGQPINSDKTGVKWPEGTDKTGLGKDIVRTIVYKATDGSAVPASVKDTLHFTAVKTVDKVTGKVLTTVWSSTQNFNDVATPAIKGYTPDKAVISDKGITYKHSNIDEVVTYVPDAQKATVTYYDDTTGKVLKTVGLKGVTHADSGYKTQDSVNGYVNLGYKLISDDTKGASIVFDNEDDIDQSFSIHFAHDYVTVIPENDVKQGSPINPDTNGAKYPEGAAKAALTHDVKRSITYVIANGKKMAPASVNDSLHYEAAATIDKVTGQVVKTVWSNAQDFKDVASPSVKGYTADKKSISDKNIAHDHANIKEVITYAPDAQKAAVTYVDQTTGKTLAVKNLSGFTLEDSGYKTASDIKHYVDNGYDLVSDSTNGVNVIFDDDDAADQAYKVVLAHGHAVVTPGDNVTEGNPINPDKNGAKWPAGSTKSALTHDVKRNITYVIANGKKTAPASVNDSLHYEAVATVDKVTGQVIKTVWSNAQDFKDVASPSVKGYTADKKSISDKNIAHDHADIKEVVTYAPDAQKAAVTYIDQTTGKTLAVKTLNGFTLEDSGYKTASSINAYKDLGYDLVSDSTNGVNVIFDDDDAADQAYKVILVHGYATVTSDMNKQAGTPINPDKNGAKWPEGSTKSALQHDVKRNITYVIANGKKTAPASVNDSLHYEATATVDKVTGQVVKTVWSAPQDFKDIASPAVKGYTADKKSISDKNVAHDHADIKEVVTYAPDAQKAAVTYIDQTTGKTLEVKTLNGFTLEDSGYNTKSSIDGYVSLGYDLVSDSSKGAGIIFDDEDGIDQAYTVVFKHGTIDVSEKNPGKPGQPINPGKGSAVWPEGTDKAGLGKDIVRTIVYKATDGSAVPASVKDTLHFTAVKTVDKVTGKVLNTVWSGTQSFNDVTTPSIKGYTPDQAVISDKGITYEHSNIDEVVTYVPDAQKATVAYYDDTTGQVLKTVSLKGVTHADSGYTTQDAIKGYVNLGYKLISDDTKGASIVFDNEDDNDQFFDIHLAHDYATITSDMDKKTGTPINPDKNGAEWPEGSTKSALQDDVKRSITYVIANGKKSAPASVNDNLHYEAAATVDKVTGQVVKTVWSNTQDFKDVVSPAVKGYTADKKSISDKNIAHDHADIKEVVTYAPDAQKAAVTYIDQTTGKVMEVKNLSGFTLEATSYNTKSAIDGYVSLGYDLVSDSSKGAEIVFDDEDGIDQAYTVVFKHGTTEVSEKNPGKPGQPINLGKGSADYPEGTDKASLGSDVKRTITYKMSDCSEAPSAVNSSLHFTAVKTIDKTTGKVIKTVWTAPQDFEDVESPAVKGYTADKKVISNKDVAHDAQNIAEVVTYAPDAQKASVAYIDDETGKSIKNDSLNGVTNAKSGYTTKNSIDAFTALGYDLVSDDTNGAEIVFDNDDAADQVFTVHFKHGTVVLTPENPGKPGESINPGEGSPVYPEDTDKDSLIDTVNRTIVYKTTDGSQAPGSVSDSLSYTAKMTVDKVTGKILSVEWTPNQDFNDVESPAVKGYTADKKVISNKNVAHDAQDIAEEVAYSPDAQKAAVTYIDDTTDKVLKVDNLDGVTNSDSKYTTKESIHEYEDKGYNLVSDDTNGASVVFDADDAVNQAYTVHLEHGTLMIGPNIGVNPVTGKDDSANLIKHVTQTIRYINSDGKQLYDPDVQILTFKRNEMIDLVTGEVLSYTPWDGPKSTKDVENPEFTDYQTSQEVVKGTSYTADSPDKTITVVYSKIAEKPAQKLASGKSKQVQKNKLTPVKGESAPAAKQEGQAQLPQTGNDNTDEAAAAGMGLVATLAMFGYAGAKKRKREE